MPLQLDHAYNAAEATGPNVVHYDLVHLLQALRDRYND